MVRCLDAYQFQRGLQEVRRVGASARPWPAMSETALLPVISDFLFDNAQEILRELSLLNSTHDVCIVLIDRRLPSSCRRRSTGWIETVDVETGRTRTMGRGAFLQMAERVREWQDDIVRGRQRTSNSTWFAWAAT